MIAIHADNPHPMTGTGNITWLLPGAEPALIDAGVGRPSHLDAVGCALDGRPLRHVYVTHHHADHAGGIEAIRTRWPDVIAWKHPAEGAAGWRALEDGALVVAGNTTLQVVHTPGHARDHVCFWDAGTRSLFGGDMVLSGTTVMIPASRGGSVREYLASLERLAALDPLRIYPGHGDVIDRPVELIREYIAHRRLRDRQVRACVEEGIDTVGAITDRIYPGLPPALRAAAEDTVRAHLNHLQSDER